MNLKPFLMTLIIIYVGFSILGVSLSITQLIFVTIATHLYIKNASVVNDYVANILDKLMNTKKEDKYELD